MKHIGFMLLHSLCASVLSYVLFTLGFRYMDAGKNSILAAGSEPVAALLLGMLFFREIPSALALVGTVLTIVALALLSRPEKAAAATECRKGPRKAPKDWSRTMRIDFHTHTFPARIAAPAIKKMQASSHAAAFLDGHRTALTASLQKAGWTAPLCCRWRRIRRRCSP